MGGSERKTICTGRILNDYDRVYCGDTVKITRCNVKQSSVKDRAHMVGGIAGQITYVNKYEITDCNVYETDILRTKSMPGEQDLDSIAGGILGFSMGAKNAKISNCKVIGKELEKGNKNTFIRGEKILVLQSLLKRSNNV